MHKSCDSRCPCCRSNSSLQSYWTVFLSVEQWPLAIMFASAVIMVGNLLALTAAPLTGFTIMAVAPALFEIVGKKSCESCGIEFENGATPIPVRRQI